MKAEEIFSQTMRDFQKVLKQEKLTMIIPETIDVKIDTEKREVIFSVKTVDKENLN